MFFNKKIKCIYCGSKLKDESICPFCGREQKPMVSIEHLLFSSIPSQDLSMLRAKKPGFLEKKIHEEMLNAANEGRICIAKAIADGIFYEEEYDSDDDVTIRERQLICTLDGSPVEGKFYEGLYFHVVNPIEMYETIEGQKNNELLLYVIRYENKKGKFHYTLINAEDINHLGEMLCQVEVPLYQMGQYEKNRFR